VTNHRTSPEVAKVCDMLFEFFQNSYRKAVHMQAEYSRMGGTGGGGVGGVGGVIPAEGEEVPQEINFRESV
jgi:uncharacterized membrane protein